MSGGEHSWLFGPGRRPVVLPTEQQARRPDRRAVVTSVGVGTLVIGLVSGFVYQQFWQDASNDATRLLPASTQVYLDAQAPWAELQSTLALDRWRASRLPERFASRGPLSPESRGLLSGIPLPALRRMLRAAARVQVGVVPTAGGLATLAIVEIPDPRRRRLVMTDLAPALETIDRQLGVDINVVRQKDPLNPWRKRTYPVHVAAVDPFLVICVGPLAALEDLLMAKVSGRSQPLRSRRGFEALTLMDATGARAYLDHEALYDLLFSTDPDDPELTARYRALVLDGVRSVTARAAVEGPDEALRVDVALAPGDTSPVLTDLLGDAGPELLAGVPTATRYVVSLAIADPPRHLGALAALLKRFAEQLGPDEWPARFAGILAAAEAAVRARLAPDSFEAVAGEIAIAELARHSADDSTQQRRWVALARFRDPLRAAELLGAALPHVFGGDVALGYVRDGDDELHMARRSSEEGKEHELLTWRVTPAGIEMASGVPTLRELDAARREGRTYGGAGLIAEATRSLPPSASAYAIVDPHALAGVANGALTRLGAAVRPDFRFGVALSLRGDTVELTTNVGPWTALALISASDRAGFEALFLPGASPTCRAGLSYFCQALPESTPCQPLQPGRAALVEDACRRATEP